MHVDAQRCIWNCLATACPGHGGGGIRELEARVGPQQGPLPTGQVFHVPPQSDTNDASELGGYPYPNADAAVDPLSEELKTRSKDLFLIPEGQQPKITSRLCAFTEDPSRLIRHQVISNIADYLTQGIYISALLNKLLKVDGLIGYRRFLLYSDLGSRTQTITQIDDGHQAAFKHRETEGEEG